MDITAPPAPSVRPHPGSADAGGSRSKFSADLPGGCDNCDSLGALGLDLGRRREWHDCCEMENGHRNRGFSH